MMLDHARYLLSIQNQKKHNAQEHMVNKYNDYDVITPGAPVEDTKANGYYGKTTNRVFSNHTAEEGYLS